MQLIFNPPDHAKYLAGLTECFGGWGDERLYQWCFARAASGPTAERMVVVDEDGSWLAGSGISYRFVSVGGKKALAGVMTGSWTVPAARGKGLFPRFIQETRKRTHERGGNVVLAFLGDIERASTRKLIEAGSRTIATAHGIGDVPSPGTTPSPADAADRKLDARVATRTDAKTMHQLLQARTSVGFVYDDEQAFAGQFIERASPTLLVQGDAGAVALIEETKDTDRLLYASTPNGGDEAAFIRALRARAGGEGRKLFAFGTGAKAAAAFERAALTVKPGVLSILAASDSSEDTSVVDALAAADWDLCAGDRI